MDVTNVLCESWEAMFTADQQAAAAEQRTSFPGSASERPVMAQAGIQTDQEKLYCSICLDPLRHPVTIPCGHSYCLDCIKSHWDEEDQKEIHSCPQCRQTFRPRPGLAKNTLLADLVEELQKPRPPAVLAVASTSYTQSGDVTCDACTGKKQKAVRSCLQCLVSYCDQHLQPHYESPAFKKHKLVDPTKKLQENICAQHDEVMKIFCRTDQQCICYLCSMDEHKGHDTVSAAAEMKEKQKELGVSRQRVQQRIQDREKDVKLLQQQLEAINRAADQAVDDSEKIFNDMKQQIRSHQRSEVSCVNEFLVEVKKEIAELKKKEAELEQHLLTDDYTHFLQNCQLSHLGEAIDSRNINVNSPSYNRDVTAAVSNVRDKLQEVSEEWTKISLTTPRLEVSLSQPEPQTRAEFLQYSCPITLDPNTAHGCVSVDENRAQRYCRHSQPFCDHPDRFITWRQVLCREGLTGRCYWEVKWQGQEVFVAVAYKDISREGRNSVFGDNDKSWVLQCFHNGYEFRHNIRTSISGPQSFRVGVYLDHSAGILAFYSVSETMTLLHRVHTTFSRPLCPGFGLNLGSVEICTGLIKED